LFYVLSGEAAVASRRAAAGQIAWSEPVRLAASAITLATDDAADTPCLVIAYSGQPIDQPDAMGGPFVMNSQAENAQAFRDSTPDSSATSCVKPNFGTAERSRTSVGRDVSRLLPR
jgi:redox-sensitive bicupin YhaK (pirin superfamily)